MKRSREYVLDVQSIVPQGVLWGAVKSSDPILDIELETQIGKLKGFTLSDGRVIALKDQSYNNIVGLSKIDVKTAEFFIEPKFATVDEPDGMRIGFFEEVYKRGYIVFPLEPYHDFDNNPIVVQK